MTNLINCIIIGKPIDFYSIPEILESNQQVYGFDHTHRYFDYNIGCNITLDVWDQLCTVPDINNIWNYSFYCVTAMLKQGECLPKIEDKSVQLYVIYDFMIVEPYQFHPDVIK